MQIELSALDELRFGMVTAKAKIGEGDSVDVLIRQAETISAELLIVRLPTASIAMAQELEKRGAILADTLVYFEKKKVESYEINLPVDYFACQAQDSDAELLEYVASECFKDYFGHYHADSRLDRVDCDAVYSSWAKNSCGQNGLADAVILIKKRTDIAAFATLKKLNSNEYEGVLYGVSPSHRKNNLHLNLMMLSQNWGLANECQTFLTSTQINNTAVQKNWCRMGLEPMNSFYTFHLWLNK